MGSYGREVEFGVSAEPLASPPDWVARVAKAADKAGLELLGIQDHPYQRRFLDTWTLISTLIPATERTRFFPDIANLPLRPPAMLAKAAASLDVLSGGRIEIGPGAEVPSGTLSWRWMPPAEAQAERGVRQRRL
ncbi:MAG: LLM class flavin-dependent oxidoreductase [Actinomycetota bacterium]|nr:LLM class flavin-dependent oxidoreductase [Actinomycetota bacterium]